MWNNEQMQDQKLTKSSSRKSPSMNKEPLETTLETLKESSSNE